MTDTLTDQQLAECLRDLAKHRFTGTESLAQMLEKAALRLEGIDIWADEFYDGSRAAAPDLLTELHHQLEAHYATWMAARAEVEGAATASMLFEKEPDVIRARAAIAKATGVDPP
jgi:recombinational DNA repair ATPase RecF